MRHKPRTIGDALREGLLPDCGENPVKAPPRPERLETGVWPSRRPLTLAEAERGALPEPFTRLEWSDMAERSRRLTALALNSMANSL